MLKSKKDDRKYRAITLPNKLKVLLISDSKTEKSAAAINVQVGHFDNKEKNQKGFAHFLEHLLFRGTKKYPIVGEYENFIESHGGVWGANTEDERTIYFFDIFNNYLEPGLDRLAQFFISPLLAEDYVDKEKHAVDAEYKMCLKNDFLRYYHVKKYTANKNHPFSRFNIGNLKTLSDIDDLSLREQVVRFWKDNYSSDLMSLVVYGDKNLSQLETWAKKYFSPIEKREHAKLAYKDIPIYTARELKRIIEVKTLADKKELLLEFPIPKQINKFKTKPAIYVVHLLKQKCENGLYEFLLKKNWINSLRVDIDRLTSQNGIFQVFFDLTDEGLRYKEDIIRATFQYIDLIKKEGIAKWRYEEIKQIAENDFNFKEKDQPLSEAYKYSTSIHYYSEKYIISAEELFFEYSEQDILKIAGCLNSDNLRVFVLYKDAKTDSVEPYFNVQFKNEKLHEKLICDLNNSNKSYIFSLPKPNGFVERNISVNKKADTDNIPKLIYEAWAIRAWYSNDNKFNNPLIDVSYLIKQPIVNDNLKNALMTDLYLNLLNEKLKIKLSSAIVAGNYFNITRSSYGVKIYLSGYSFKNIQIMNDLINEEFKKVNVSKNRFEAMKSKLLLNYLGKVYETPIRKQVEDLTAILKKNEWLVEQKIEELQNVEFFDMVDFAKGVLDGIALEFYVYGNIEYNEAKNYLKDLGYVYNLNMKGIGVSHESITWSLPNAFLKKETRTKHNDSAILLFYQPSDKKYSTVAKTLLLERILSGPFFTELRTKKQFGYAIKLMSFKLYSDIGLMYLIQSPSADAFTVTEAIKTFIKEYSPFILNNMKSNDFNMYKESIVNDLLKKTINRDEEVNNYAKEIFEQTYKFNREEKVAKTVDSITLKELISFFKDLHLSENNRVLLLYTRDQKIDGMGGTNIGSSVVSVET